MKQKPKKELLLKLSIASFVTIIAASAIFSGLYSILLLLEVKIEDLWWTVIIATISSIIIGIILSTIMNIVFLNPINELVNVTKRVAEGDFSVQLKEHTKKNGELKKDEMSVLTHNFNVMVHELDKNKILKSDFVTNVSHEFKTPLANIKGHAEIIKKCKDTKEIKEYCDNIIEAADNLSNLTSNILRLSKLENHVILEASEFRADEQIRQAIILLENKWEEKNINFNLDLDEITIFSDEALFMQVWLNLISNAIKFSNDGGDINIILKKYGQDAVLTIKDEGIGMSKEVKERIFERFYQGDTSRAKEGSGLGLALVKKILDISHCTIEVESEEGKGTTFVVRIPMS